MKIIIVESSKEVKKDTFFMLFSSIFVPILIKILLETIILQHEYKIVETERNAKFDMSNENTAGE